VDRPVLRLAFIGPSLVLSACSVAGPNALHNGRSAYNDVINATEDQQVLQMIVRHRYDETFGLLAVASVTASLRVSASVGGNVGIGPDEGYAGNLVPLSLGLAYEENPTISYVPIRGEKFMERMLAPISAEQVLLLSRMSTHEIEALRWLVRRANGLANPFYYSPPRAAGPQSAFDRFITLYGQLRDEGMLDIVRTPEGQFEMLIHDFTDQETAAVNELLLALRIERKAEPGTPISVPVRFFVGSPQADGVDLETPSALEVIDAASEGVRVPEEHLTTNIARASTRSEGDAFIAIGCSPGYPATASVAVKHRGWWFFLDDRDARSKQGFVFLRTLIGLRMDEASPGQGAPILTIPAAR
jgi:hypothetical protein